MRHEMLTQRALFCHHANTKPGTLSQHFVTHVVPPLTLNHAVALSNSMHAPCMPHPMLGHLQDPIYSRTKYAFKPQV